jgi:hypothetical protein
MQVSGFSAPYYTPFQAVSQRLSLARAVQPTYRPDQFQASTPVSPAGITWTPALKIALMATPVAVGAGIGLARGAGAVGGLWGGAIGAAVSIVGLWWHMTVGNPFAKNPPISPEPPPKPPI